MTNKKLCSLCHETMGQPGDVVTVRALAHWVNKHPYADTLKSVLEQTELKVDCVECGQTHRTPVVHGPGYLGANSYCGDCVEDDPLRELVAREMPPNAIIACEVTR